MIKKLLTSLTGRIHLTSPGKKARLGNVADAINEDEVINLGQLKNYVNSKYNTITDSSSIVINRELGNNFTWSADGTGSTVSFSNTNEGQYIDITLILSATSKILTFPTNTLCINSDGTASGDNTCTLSGVSGDSYRIAIAIEQNGYKVVAKNFGQ